MKKLLFLLILIIFASCEKEECWYCREFVTTKWGVIIEEKPLEVIIRPVGCDSVVYHSEICDRTKEWILEYMKENTRTVIFNRNGYNYVEKHLMHCNMLTCIE